MIKIIHLYGKKKRDDEWEYLGAFYPPVYSGFFVQNHPEYRCLKHECEYVQEI